MSAAMAQVAREQSTPRTSVLFDSFQGLPAPKPIDGPGASAWARDPSAPGYYNNCTADVSEAEEAMARSGAWDVRIIKGWFEDTVPLFAAEERPIAVLRL